MKASIFGEKSTTKLDKSLQTGTRYPEEQYTQDGNIAAEARKKGFLPGKKISPILLNTALYQISYMLCGILNKVLNDTSDSVRSALTYDQDLTTAATTHLWETSYKLFSDFSIDSDYNTNMVNAITPLIIYLNSINRMVDTYTGQDIQYAHTAKYADVASRFYDITQLTEYNVIQRLQELYKSTETLLEYTRESYTGGIL